MVRCGTGTRDTDAAVAVGCSVPVSLSISLPLSLTLPPPSSLTIYLFQFLRLTLPPRYDSDFSGEAFRAAAKGVDPTRPVTANGALSQTPTAQLDIQGGSHWGNSTFSTSHARNGTMAQVGGWLGS